MPKKAERDRVLEEGWRHPKMIIVAVVADEIDDP